MFRLWWCKILSLFGKKQNNDDTIAEANEKFTMDYENTNGINFTAIFSNKLANYVVNDSNIDLKGDDKRTELLKKPIKKLKKKLKKIVSRMLGTGGILIVPYIANNKIYFDIVSQNRLSINKKIGDDIIDCTIMAEHIVKNKNHYYRWADYTLNNNTLYIRYRATIDGELISMTSVSEWASIQDMIIPNVDRMPFMFLKSPIDNRHESDDYGVPITYGCQKEIRDIKDTLKQILREFDLKEAFVGADVSMFKGDRALPLNGLYRKINAGEDDFWEVFDPAYRDTPLFNKLMQQCALLEKQIGTSKGILTDPLSTYQNTDETRRGLYDTFSIVHDIRDNISEGLEDFLYACDVLANYYNLTPMGKYEIKEDWDYTFIEDSASQWNQLVQGHSKGAIKTVELRQFIKPNETLEEAQKVIDEISESEPDIDTLLNGNKTPQKEDKTNKKEDSKKEDK
jgi:hypothetical protein